MDPAAIWSLVALIILIVLSAIFSASETAYSTASRTRLQTYVEDGNKRAKSVLKLLDNYDKILSTLLVGNNIVNITAATLGTILFASLIADAGVANTVSTAVITVVVLIFGEITPKTVAKEKPESFAMGIYPFIRFCMWILYPITIVFTGWKWLLSKVFRFKKEVTFTEEELITIVETAESEGEIEAHESELIRSAIEFEDSEVIDIMIPRVNVVALNVEEDVEGVYDKYVESGYSRLPVYRETIDNIVGVLHEKDFYRYMHDGGKHVEEIVQKTLCVPTSMKVSSVLREMQGAKVHMAIVVDEFGGTMGIVTLEDILEELVGEIYDEHDDVEELRKQISDNVYLVSGEENLEDLLDDLDVSLNENIEEERIDATTVGGFVTEQMDKIPSVGEEFMFKNLKFEITQVSETRVQEVKLTVLSEEEVAQLQSKSEEAEEEQA